ncbi:DUF935 domain-containing protein [Streptosporangium sp. NBC_01810]|uniref:phage portal protein family protein n=1 Tax=Streptosporangium sp. NBC_01810 TaxID=2975951 RepID=UPI002DDC70EE|nr:hypothetical protein [Streptosporangium sp. NBC_01810]WSA27427.1 DUF935 domain-containing protein [Streptosporangium sp. NBC_01810]
MVAIPTRDIGQVDTLQYGSLLADWLEFVPDLQWPLSVQTYSRMRHDPKLAGILGAYTLPIRRATWVVDPAGCRDEVVQLVADDLGLPIKGVDEKPGGARRRGVIWGEHLRHALLSLVYGHMVFERRYEIVDGMARLAALGERMPHTIGEITINRDGTVKSVSQDVVSAADIPANRLVWYVHEREGANWTGRSLLRAAYGAWLLKHEVWRVHATSIRRFGMGVPSVTAPPGATPAQVTEATRLASAMRVGDQSGAGLPHGFQVRLTGLTGSTPDAIEFVRYLDQQMSVMALAGILDLGQTETGSRALGDSFVELLRLSLQTVADDLARVATSGHGGMPGIVTQLVDFNFGETEPAPVIVATDVGDQHEVTAEAIQMLVTSGALAPDPELDSYLRQAWRLPVRKPGTPAPAPQPDPAPAPAQARRRTARSQQHAAAAPTALAGRPMTEQEIAAGMDPDAMHEAWEAAVAALLVAWAAGIATAWTATLATLIAAAVDSGDLAALGTLQLDSADAQAVLAEQMATVAQTSAEQLVAEAAGQGVEVEPPPVDVEQLGQVAAAVAALLASGLAAAAGREALRRAAPGANGVEVAEAVTTYLDGLTDASLRSQLGGAITAAQQAGRFAALESALEVNPDGLLIASEVNDVSTCGPCREIDGTEFADLGAAMAAYPVGGYVACKGGVRCRGTVFGLWS